MSTSQIDQARANVVRARELLLEAYPNLSPQNQHLIGMARSNLKVALENLPTRTPAVVPTPKPTPAPAPKPPADTAGSKTPNGVVIVRNSEEYGGPNEMPKPSSIIFLQDLDPNLENALATYKQGGHEVGIWTSNSGPFVGTGVALANHAAGLVLKYGIAHLAVDVEDLGVGVQGEPGWVYNETLVNQLRSLGALAPLRTFAVMPTGLLGDVHTKTFNYYAYTAVGGQVWPQTYTGNMGFEDATDVINHVVGRGVDPAVVMPILAPGQKTTWPTRGVYAPPANYTWA